MGNLYTQDQLPFVLKESGAPMIIEKGFQWFAVIIPPAHADC